MSDGTLVCGFVWLAEGDSHRPEAPVHLAVSRDHGMSWAELIRLPDGENPRHGRWSHYGSLREIEPSLILALFDVIPGSWNGPVRYVASREIRFPC